MNDEIKALLEELNISEETATQIGNVISEAIEKAKEDGKAEGLTEGAAASTDEKITALQEAHDLEITSLLEKANEYGDFLKEKANAYGEVIKETLTEKVKEYADSAIEDFIAENRERFVETEEYQRIKGAFEIIKESFERNGFEVRDDVYTQELKQSLEESTDEYEKVFEENVALKAQVDTLNRSIFLKEATADLAETQKEKVSSLLENVSFETQAEFEEGVALIVEQAKAASTVSKDVVETLNEEVVVAATKAPNESVQRWAQNLL